MIKLGMKVRDRITGYEGIVTAACKYLNGCVSLQVEADQLKEDGDVHKPKWIDFQQLEILDAVAFTYLLVADERPGGPGPKPVLSLPPEPGRR